MKEIFAGDQEIALTGPITLGHEYSFSSFLAGGLFFYPFSVDDF
jgi:hypothetical protein